MEQTINMAAAKISQTQQFLHENKTWCRLLDFFKQENSYLKTRLSEVVDIITNKEFLALAEQFQNKFILKDEYINELKQDIIRQEFTLNELKGCLPDEKTAGLQSKFRNEMEYFEKDFNKLKNGFNKYLSSSVL